MSEDNEAAARIYLDGLRKDNPDDVSYQVLEILWEKIDEINRRLESLNGHVHRGTGMSGWATASQTGPPIPRRW